MTIPRTICLGFLSVIAIGTILLMMPFAASEGTWTHPMVALFTSTSAVCVTGLVVVDTGSYFSFWGQLIVLALFQIGGLGYMTTTTFLILILGRKFKLKQKIAIQQALDRQGLQDSAALIRSIIATAIIFEITGIFLLLLVFVPDYGLYQGFWLAIFHSVSAWNNAGFSLFPDSLTSYQSSLLLNLVITALIICGGIGQQVIFEFYLWLRDRILRRRQSLEFSLNFKVVTSTTIFLLIVGTIAFLFIEFNNDNTLGASTLSDKFIKAWFQSVTTRTAGFNTIDLGKMTTAGLFITITMMFFGASPGGTGGGIKTTTVRVLVSSTQAILQGKEDVYLYKRQVPIELILKAIGVLVGSCATVIISTLLISLAEPTLDFIQILFEVVSAFATVGLSTGITPDVSTWAKLVLIGTMYIGRVGVLLLMASLLGEPRPSAVQYPEENLLVG
ncbi:MULTISPECIES: TrkH family potassium uptake protein [Moorena]|uniref:Potassium uptake protein, TrkH family n=1 Tax=Moorena producens 3L TaxID=489825 RepID=F4XQT5_9CYAN|nr:MULTISPECIES: TrkH family potassium uptake protein [Moorena]NES86140.1 ATPase [Moorena sp. SIO2B7]EGJ33114.1 potassium uptake protein, TrkH family [Moorena producens 3L]NEP35040.1 ATPase [Moorena sp. SIO3B2]NEP69842.1 ATPase [Moorena sp. SIO3A5]NEQ07773.1 ATPase [Moorena sp. SIO4E2]